MALVRNIKLIPAGGRGVHSPAECGAFAFTDATGERFLQLEVQAGPVGARLASVRRFGRELDLAVGFVEELLGLPRVPAQVPFIGRLRTRERVEGRLNIPLGGREVGVPP